MGARLHQCAAQGLAQCWHMFDWETKRKTVLVLPLQELTRPTWGERASAQRAASVGGVAADLLRELEESARGRGRTLLEGQNLVVGR